MGSLHNRLRRVPGHRHPCLSPRRHEGPYPEVPCRELRDPNPKHQQQHRHSGLAFLQHELRRPNRVKNANFGPYKYDTTTVDFTYSGALVGQAQVPKSKANFRSTKKINVLVNLSSSLGNDLSKGVLTLSSTGTMNGKVKMMLIFKKKKKSTRMNCTMEINLSSKPLQSIHCE